MLAAALACDEDTVVSHGSAAELLGLWDKRLPVIHVIPLTGRVERFQASAGTACGSPPR